MSENHANHGTKSDFTGVSDTPITDPASAKVCLSIFVNNAYAL